MHVKLKILRGASAGKIVTAAFPASTLAAPRNANCGRTATPSVGVDCAITVTDTDARIRDLGSRNGTFVNGERIDGEHKIQMGDQLRVGPLEFLVTFVQPVGDPSASPPRPRRVAPRRTMRWRDW